MSAFPDVEFSKVTLNYDRSPREVRFPTPQTKGGDIS
jgi:hypothetical protein